MPASSRHALVDENGEEFIRPGCFSRCVVRCPCCITWLTFVIALGMAYVGFRGAKLDAAADAGYDTDTVPQQVSWYAWVKVYERRFFIPPVNVTTGGPSIDSKPIFFVYEALPGVDMNVFTPDAVERIAAFERTLLEQTDFPVHCAKATNRLGPGNSSMTPRNTATTNCSSPLTVLNYLYVNDGLQASQCRQGYCDILDLQYRIAQGSRQPFVPSLATCENGIVPYGYFPCTSTIYDWRHGVLAPPSTWASQVGSRLFSNPDLAQIRNMLFDKNAICANGTLRAAYVRSLYSFERIVEADDDADEGFGRAYPSVMKKMISAMDDAQTALGATPTGAGKMRYTGAPLNLFWMCGYSPAFGWCDPDADRLLSTYLNPDLFLAQWSAIVIAVLLLTNTSSLLLMLAGLFEIIISVPVAMFVWFIIGQGTVNTIMLIGLFIVLCIGADDIFVFIDTWKESYHMGPAIAGTVLTRFAWTWNRAAAAMLATTATTVFCLLINYSSSFPTIRVFGLFNAFVIAADFILVITWFAAGTVALEQCAKYCCPPGQDFEFSCCLTEGKCKGSGRRTSGPDKTVATERWATAFFKDTIAPAIYRGRWVLLLLSSIVWIIGIIVVSVNFVEGESSFFKLSHPVSLVAKMFTDQFYSPVDTKAANVVVYGLQDIPVQFPKAKSEFAKMEDNCERARARLPASFLTPGLPMAWCSFSPCTRVPQPRGASCRYGPFHAQAGENDVWARRASEDCRGL